MSISEPLHFTKLWRKRVVKYSQSLALTSVENSVMLAAAVREISLNVGTFLVERIKLTICKTFCAKEVIHHIHWDFTPFLVFNIANVWFSGLGQRFCIHSSVISLWYVHIPWLWLRRRFFLARRQVKCTYWRCWESRTRDMSKSWPATCTPRGSNEMSFILLFNGSGRRLHGNGRYVVHVVLLVRRNRALFWVLTDNFER